jgi:hypothetical protein
MLPVALVLPDNSGNQVGSDVGIPQGQSTVVVNISEICVLTRMALT